MRTLPTAAAFMLISGGAYCQVIVNDPPSLFQQIKSVVQGAQAYVLQGQQYLTSAQQLASFVQNPSLGAAAGVMGMTGLSNDLPVNPYSLMSLTSGYSMSLGGLGAKLSALSSLSNASYNQSHVYDCTDNSWACTQQKQRGYGLAGRSGIAQAAYENFREHMPVVEALRARAATANTPAERENVLIALQSEQAWHENLAGQINAAEMQAKADEASLAQQDNERMSKDIDATIAQIPGG